jgi:general stress protein 26
MTSHTDRPEGNAIQADTQTQEHLWTLIRDIRFAMFTTRHGNGHLHSRPMTTQSHSSEQHDRLWFFMSRGSDPVDDLRTEPNVNVSFADTSKDCYVSVTGTGRVVDDPEKARALWTPMADAWFPGGVDDPDLALVEVLITHAHYWDVKESKITQLYKMAKAAVTGKPPTGMGEQGEVRMR